MNYLLDMPVWVYPILLYVVSCPFIRLYLWWDWQITETREDFRTDKLSATLLCMLICVSPILLFWGMGLLCWQIIKWPLKPLWWVVTWLLVPRRHGV